MMTRQQYIEYLISTPINSTCSNLAAHLDGASHDAVSDFLVRNRTTAHNLWQQVKGVIHASANSSLIIDESVQDKRSSTKMRARLGGPIGCALWLALLGLLLFSLAHPSQAWL